jgi:glycosyltransferase involved in cell wall biosynthesis
MAPCVSVVLPVYNVADYIGPAINSVLKQTFVDFELLVFDDCSTDETAAKIQAITDPRLRFFQNNQNLGRAGTDNAAIPHVRGEFIAKMDGDDLCHPERLARQVAYLKSHPEVNMVGSWMQNFGTSSYLNRYPATPEAAQVLTLFTPPIGNPSVMMRASLLREGNMRYNETLRQAEDYDFFARYLRDLRIVTLPETLIQYRVPAAADTRRAAILDERASTANALRARLLSDWGLGYTARELHVHNTIAVLERPLGDVSLPEAEAWLCRLLRHNHEQPLFEPAALRQGLGKRWFEVCYAHPQPRLQSVRQFKRSSLAAGFSTVGSQRLLLWVKGIWRL